MKSQDPQRWREIAPGDAIEQETEAEIGAAIRAAAAAPPWDDLRVAQIRQNVLRASAQARAEAAPVVRARRRLPTWAIAAACVLLGAAATAMASYALNRRQRTAAPAPVAAAAIESTRAHRRGSPARAAATPPVVEVAPAPQVAAPAPAPNAEALEISVAPPVRRPVRPASAPAPRVLPSREPPAEAPPPGEADDLAAALRQLRGDGDARGALARLDDYQRRHPTGALAREAALARVEALLSLGRDTAALDVLDGLALDGAEVDRRVALARAELRAAAGRCADAVGDFARARSGDANDDVAARALYGEGVCDLRTGDRRAARAAFETYQRRFPNGPRRADVERALANLGG
ncbi:MAG TPA: hypothetical protein VN903_11060 [Polyangia bacterium]|jgi:TolA-binding protein|nr:hypothetical protein [Polyangia bacterium]